MLNPTHYLHLILHLLIEDSILNKATLLQLLCGIRLAVVLGGDFVHDCEGALADRAYPVVLA